MDNYCVLCWVDILEGELCEECQRVLDKEDEDVRKDAQFDIDSAQGRV